MTRPFGGNIWVSGDAPVADPYIPLVAPWFPSVRWRTGSDDVWLTFDDGPHPIATPGVLDALRQAQAGGTFFLLGANAARHPELVRKIREHGHVIGNHADVHDPVWFRSRKTVTERLRRASDAIEQAGGERPALFRPPYGRLDPSTPVHARAAGLATVMFTVNSWDFGADPVSSIVARVLRRTCPGDIILLHDNDRTAPFAGELVSEIIRRVRESGLTFGKPLV
jgi:peptidoglycan/xylan/chitin deacetylase (PgdA/CDA1 family)